MGLIRGLVGSRQLDVNLLSAAYWRGKSKLLGKSW